MPFVEISLLDRKEMSIDSEKIQYVVDHEKRPFDESPIHDDLVATMHLTNGESIEICNTASEIAQRINDITTGQQQQVEEHIYKFGQSFENAVQKKGGEYPNFP